MDYPLYFPMVKYIYKLHEHNITFPASYNEILCIGDDSQPISVKCEYMYFEQCEFQDGRYFTYYTMIFPP